MANLFIVFEGLDGAGTTTQANLLSEWFTQNGTLCKNTFEPCGPTTGVIREAIDSGEHTEDLPWHFASARAWHTSHVIRPCLQDRVVVCDRYIMSSLAYQSLAGFSISYLWELNKHFPVPDITFFLRVSADVCVERLSTRDRRDTFENRETLRRVESRYNEAIFHLRHLKQHKIVEIDGTLSIDKISQQVREHVSRPLADSE